MTNIPYRCTRLIGESGYKYMNIYGVYIDMYICMYNAYKNSVYYL